MTEETIIIGAGPCGLACALELKKHKMNSLIIEKGNIVDTIYRFPTHQTFFSSSENLEIGGFPFVSDKPKPVRNDALAYYREVVKRNKLRINAFETVTTINKNKDELFQIHTIKNDTDHQYVAKNIIIATGYYSQPQLLNIPGESLPKVMHYFKEAHSYYGMDVVVIGGRNSAVDTALELYRAGANVTVLYRGIQYSSSIKPWILPEFDSLVQKGKIHLHYHSNVTRITNENVHYEINGIEKMIQNDFVFAMTGYAPDISFLKKSGIQIESKTGKPLINQNTYETNVSNLYVAGTVISGYNGNETFIENGRLHSGYIAKAIINNE